MALEGVRAGGVSVRGSEEIQQLRREKTTDGQEGVPEGSGSWLGGTKQTLRSRSTGFFADKPAAAELRISNLSRYDKSQPDLHQRIFKTDYDESRASFLSDAAEIDQNLRAAGHPGAQIQSIAIPHPKGGPTRYIDVLHIPAAISSDKAAIVTTGVHGLEGPIGPAMVRTWYGNLLDQFNFNNTSLTVVHGVNPHGWVENRRENAQGIDLNRADLELKPGETAAKVDAVGNAAQQKVRPELELSGKAGGLTRATLRTYGRLVKGLVTGEYKEADVVNALGYGQTVAKDEPAYLDPQARVPEILALNKVLEPVVASHDEIVHLDVHSGVTGKVSLLQRLTGKARLTAGLWTSTGQSAEDNRFTLELAKNKGKLLAALTDADLPYIDTGDIPYGVQKMPRKPGAKVSALTYEQATLRFEPLGLSARELQYQGLRNGWKSEKDRQNAEDFLQQVFVPRDETWRRAATDNFNQTHAMMAPFLRDDWK